MSLTLSEYSKDTSPTPDKSPKAVKFEGFKFVNISNKDITLKPKEQKTLSEYIVQIYLSEAGNDLIKLYQNLLSQIVFDDTNINKKLLKKILLIQDEIKINYTKMKEDAKAIESDPDVIEHEKLFYNALDEYEAGKKRKL